MRRFFFCRFSEHSDSNRNKLFSEYVNRPKQIQMKNRLKILRTENDFTQADLSIKLEVSRQTIYAIEKGKFDSSLPLAFKVAKLFQLPIKKYFKKNKIQIGYQFG